MNTPTDFDPALVLKELRTTRRRQRLANIDWFDAAYHAYLAGIVAIVITLVIAGAVGDAELSPGQLASVDRRGAAVVGLAIAVAVAIGLRSGSRGGPLALEAAEVRHVLLAPVDRGAALRSSAFRQLRFALFVGAAGGAVGGEMASKRFQGSAFAWVGSGALVGVCAAAALIGTALVASGRHLPRWMATIVAGLLLGWAMADVSARWWSPFRVVGAIGLWPRTFDAVSLVAIVMLLAIVLVGIVGIGGLHLDAAERRTGLVGQLRFAVTMQDLRTVIVLRRQLAQDQPRERPWIRTRRASKHLVIARRSWRSYLRFPVGRLGRLVILVGIAAVSLRAAWHGTSPLVVVAAFALYVAALDVVEPLAQQNDHEDHTERLPIERGVLFARLLIVPAIVMGLLGAVGFGIVMALERRSGAVAVAAVLAVPAVLGALAGAVVSVLLAPPEPFKDGQLLPPEVAGMKIVIRTAWPLVSALLGCLPVVLAAKAAERGEDALAPAAAGAGYCGLVVVGTAVWVRYRDPIKLWWRTTMAESQQVQRERSAAKAKR